MSIVSTLKLNPTSAFGQYGFVVNIPYAMLGGSCSISSKVAKGNVHHLNVSIGGGPDYFFPYVSAGTLGLVNGVGCCDVPQNAPVGTLVVTGGMNGCALQVSSISGNYRFFHDANGTSLAGSAIDPGNHVCRVDYKSYDTLNLGQKKSSMGTVYAHYLITVKTSHRWEVWRSSILFGMGDYKKFSAGITDLLTTF
jgi:hypothetical protein